MAKVRGSKNGKIINARFEGQSKSLFPTLKQTKAVVLLSIKGNEFCTQDYLKVIIEKAIATYEFTTFLVADEIYWHNLRNDFSDKEEKILRKKANELGDSYLEDNLKHFLTAINLNINEFLKENATKCIREKTNLINEIARDSYHFEIVSWRNWLAKSPSYIEKRDTIMGLYGTEEKLATSIEQTAANFARRHSNNEPIELLHRRSQGYLIEECPAIMWIAASLNYNFIAYPGEMIKPFKETKEFFVKENKEPCLYGVETRSEHPHKLVNWLEISFQRGHSKEKNGSHSFTFDERGAKEPATELSELAKGVTQGIFSLDLTEDGKLDLLVNFIMRYNDKKNNTIFRVEK